MDNLEIICELAEKTGAMREKIRILGEIDRLEISVEVKRIIRIIINQ